MKTRIALVVLLVACGDDPASPPAVASVQVTSPIGTLWDVGANAQLAAVALDAQGNTVSGAMLTWTSTNSQVVSVSAGFIRALAVGTATIRAEAGAVASTLSAEVVDADLAGVTTVASDPFAGALVNGTTSAVRTRLLAAASACVAAAGSGNLQAIQQCVAGVRTEAGSVTDPTDRALLAVLSLFADRLELLLNV
jgi:hypothetical protein